MSNSLMYGCIACLIASGAFAQSSAQLIKFQNIGNMDIVIIMRIGSIGINPDVRGQANATIKAGQTLVENVGAGGDIWFAYGNKIINSNEKPPLCNAKVGATIVLNKAEHCFVNN
jgi:hypothetical protein